jgi:hypothetical protein
MPTMPRPCLRAALIATTLVALAACQKPAPAESSGTLPASPVTVAAADAASIARSSEAPVPAPSLGDFKVVRLSLGRSLDVGNDIADERSVFSPRDPVYAVVVTTGTHQGLMLSARWFDGDGKLLAQNDQRMVPDGPMLASFHLNPPGGWPKGHYKLDIALDGQSMQSKEFDVR